jgi:ketosteroid isomerase-like protein
LTPPPLLDTLALKRSKERLMGEQSVEVVRGVYEAFGRGDVPAVLGAMADDIDGTKPTGCPMEASTTAERQ